MVENDRKALLNGLSDAIKEVTIRRKHLLLILRNAGFIPLQSFKCQLRFGGKRELATETDGRVCFLCSKLEHIFLHGLKRKANNISTNFVLANTKSTLINLK